MAVPGCAGRRERLGWRAVRPATVEASRPPAALSSANSNHSCCRACRNPPRCGIIILCGSHNSQTGASSMASSSSGRGPQGGRGFALIRVSKDIQDRRSQVEKIKRWLAERGLEVIEWIEDAQARDMAHKRPQFQRLLELVRAG